MLQNAIQPKREEATTENHTGTSRFRASGKDGRSDWAVETEQMRWKSAKEKVDLRFLLINLFLSPHQFLLGTRVFVSVCVCVCCCIQWELTTEGL